MNGRFSNSSYTWQLDGLGDFSGGNFYLGQSYVSFYFGNGPSDVSIPGVYAPHYFDTLNYFKLDYINGTITIDSDIVHTFTPVSTTAQNPFLIFAAWNAR